MNQEKTTEEWLKIFEVCRLSGLSIRRWCKENQFSENAYRYWYDKLVKKQNKPAAITTFAEITMPPKNNQSAAGHYPFRIHYKGIHIDLDSSTDSLKLAEIIKTLSGV